MHNTRFLLTIPLLFLATVCTRADTLSGSGSFQSWNASVLATTGGPYWNSTSGDGPNYNIGWCLTGGGNCHISDPPGALNYFGNTTAPASTMSFTSNGSPQQATLRGVITNQNSVPPSGTDYFGWYSVSGGTIATHQLFSSASSIGSVANFTPTATYGFYLENVQSPGLSYEADYFWLMDDSLDYVAGTGVLDPGAQHFTVFSASGGFYLAAEDTPAPTADFDYNDMIVSLTPTPEPATLAFVSGAMGLLTCVIRRRRA